MISHNQAKAIVRGQITALAARRVPLAQALGCVLAQDIASPVDLPPFDQAAMDGYAFRYEDAGKELRVVDIVPAGSAERLVLEQGQAARIFTGAPIPENADTVIMQEYTRELEGQLQLADPNLVQGGNVRFKGSEVRWGERLLPGGTVLNPAAIGFLASAGMAEVTVFPMPKVAMLVTGDELQPPGKPLIAGQVYEANSYALQAALQQLGIRELEVRHVADHPEQLVSRLSEALEKADLVLLTGGISVGERDYVKRAIERCGVTEGFYKVRQKPGKPLYFGVKGHRPVFGLPGNPASVLVCFYQYVVLALEQLTRRRMLPEPVWATVTGEGKKRPGLTYFLKGRYMPREGAAQVLMAQESFRLSSFAGSNCLICLPESAEEYRNGEEIEVQLLPRWDEKSI
jgi:molybdenum cofactor synthesis domain